MWVVFMLFGIVVVSLLLSMLAYPPPPVGKIEREP
jgi:hypothetical protein